MKKSLICIVAGCLLMTTFVACKKEAGSSARAKEAKNILKTQQDSVSYAIGMSIGQNLKKSYIDVNPEIFLRAIKDANDTTKVLLNEEQAKALMMRFSVIQQKKIDEIKKKEAAENIAAGEKFLASNKTKPGVVTTASGLQYKIIKAGNGPKPNDNQMVVVNYRLTNMKGEEIDSSYQYKQPATFPVKGMIPGFVEAIKLMGKGAKWQLFIPAKLGYGEQGAGDKIAPNSVLIFEVELLDIQNAPAKK